MTSSADLIRQARERVSALPAVPTSRRAVLTCMDARIDPLRALDLKLGEAHILRNAGGVVTGDVVRSLIVSQRALNTNRVDVMMHTRCGMQDLDEDVLRRAVADAGGVRHDRGFGGFHDLEAELRRGVEVLRSTPALADTSKIFGHVVDIDTGRVRTLLRP